MADRQEGSAARVRYGLPDVYPFNEPGFVREQEASARWVEYQGPTENTTRWELSPGTVLEIWPGGAVFNEHGTLMGWLNLTDYGVRNADA